MHFEDFRRAEVGRVFKFGNVSNYSHILTRLFILNEKLWFLFAIFRIKNHALSEIRAVLVFLILTRLVEKDEVGVHVGDKVGVFLSELFEFPVLEGGALELFVLKGVAVHVELDLLSFSRLALLLVDQVPFGAVVLHLSPHLGSLLFLGQGNWGSHFYVWGVL